MPGQHLRVIGKGGEPVMKALAEALEKSDDLCAARPGVCHGNMGISRSVMPQLSEDPMEEFLIKLAKDGVRVTRGPAEVGKLRASQMEILTSKVLGMSGSVRGGGFSGITTPIIVSSDGFIVDGHHRWATLMTLDHVNKMEVYRVDMPIDKLLVASAQADGVEFRSLHDDGGGKETNEQRVEMLKKAIAKSNYTPEGSKTVEWAKQGGKARKSFRPAILIKGGPFIGPRGGKWADAKHTIPYKAPRAKKKAKPAPRRTKKDPAPPWWEDESELDFGIGATEKALSKAMQKPPGQGWQRIPGGRIAGGRRRLTGRSDRAYEYWYPNQLRAQSKYGWEVDEKAKPKAGDLVYVGNGKTVYRVVPEHAKKDRSETWVRAEASGRFRRVKKSALKKLKKVKRGRPKVPSKVPPKKARGKKKPAKQPAPKPPSRRKAKVFKDSKADKDRNPVLWNIENGKYYLQRHKDADRKKQQWGIYVPPGHEKQFIEEFRGQIIGAAKRTAKSFGIEVVNRAVLPTSDYPGRIVGESPTVTATTVAYDNLISAATMGLVMALSTYTGGRPFAPRSWDYCLAYAQAQARTEMGAGANVTTRQMGMLKGFFAAKARAYDRLKGRAPTNKDIAREWTVLKRDVFSGKMGTYSGLDEDGKRVTHRQGSQKIPMDEWYVKDSEGNPVGKPKPGLLKLADVMQNLAQGNKVADSEWLIQYGSSAPEVEASTLPLGEQLRRRDEVERVVARMDNMLGDALWMKLGLDDVGGKGATTVEIADALGILPKSAASTRRKAVGEVLKQARVQASSIAADLGIERTPRAPLGRREAFIKQAWIKDIEADAPARVEVGTGPSWRDLMERFGGSQERAMIYAAAAKEGRADEVAAILEREAKQKASAAESHMVRELRAAVERKAAVREFHRISRQYKPVGPAADVNPYLDLGVERVPGGQGTARWPAVGPLPKDGPTSRTVNEGPSWQPQDDENPPHTPWTGATYDVALNVALDPDLSRLRMLRAMYQIERAVPPDATPEQRAKMYARGPQPRSTFRKPGKPVLRKPAKPAKQARKKKAKRGKGKTRKTRKALLDALPLHAASPDT